MPTLNELTQKRAKLITDARAIQTAAETAKRDMTSEENANFNRMLDVDLGEIDKQITSTKAHEDRMRLLATEEARLSESAGRRSNPGEIAGTGNEQRGNATAPTELRYKVGAVERVIALRGHRATTAYRNAFSRALINPFTALAPDEQRALQADSDTQGGYLQAPQVFAAQLIQQVDNLVFVRRVANVLPPLIKAESLGIPSRESDISDSDWTAEIGTGQEDTSLTFGKRELKPHPIAKRIKVSKKLLRSSSVDPEGVVRDRLGYKSAVTQEKAYLLGSGVNQPLGVFTASSNGISTARDFSTGNTSTTIGADGLFEAKYQLKVQYWDKAQWAFHRDALKMIAKLKDGEGQYLWQPSLTVGNPDRLLGFAVNVSEYAPNTFTTGKYVGILGDWGQYWIVDSLDMSIQALLELYAETNQNGYILRAETDGMPVLEEAFARVTLG